MINEFSVCLSNPTNDEAEEREAVMWWVINMSTFNCSAYSLSRTTTTHDTPEKCPAA